MGAASLFFWTPGPRPRTFSKICFLDPLFP